MTTKSTTEKNCTPQLCETCATRMENPLCSVDEARKVIERVRSTVKFKADQTVFYQGNEPIGLYVIQSGLVKLESTTEEGSSLTRRLLGPGQALGYRSLFANEVYQASAVTIEDSEFCFLPKQSLMAVVQEYPEVAVNLLRQLSLDLRTAEEKWVLQVEKGAAGRVAEALVFLDEHFDNQVWTRKEIAEWAGTTPETVMRTLTLFDKKNLIKTEGRRIVIVNRQELIEQTSKT